jgi:hypothetical protein
MVGHMQTKLSEIIEDSNRIFSFPMALVMGVCIIGSTFSSFEIYDMFVTEKTFSQILYGAGTSIVSFHYEVHVMIAVASCRMVKAKERGIVERLHGEMMSGRKSFRNKRRIQLLLLQMEHEDVQFSCGLFEFNWKIVITVSCW